MSVNLPINFKFSSSLEQIFDRKILSSALQSITFTKNSERRTTSFGVVCWDFAIGKAVEQGALEQLSTHVWYVQIAVIPTCLLPLNLHIKPAKTINLLQIHNQSASALFSRDYYYFIILWSSFVTGSSSSNVLWNYHWHSSQIWFNEARQHTKGIFLVVSPP